MKKNLLLFLSFILFSIPGLSQDCKAFNAKIKVKSNPCIPFDKAELTVEVSGGKIPYKYEWSTGSSKFQITVNEPGDYFLKVYDASGCETSSRTEVKVHAPIEVVATVNNTSNTESKDGRIHIEIQGGVPPYNCYWFGQGINYIKSKDISGLKAGVYTLVVQDKSSCSYSANYEVKVEN